MSEKEFTHKTSLPEPVASDLSNVLTKYQKRITDFPSYIDNDLVLEGIEQRFTLLGKKIRTLNIGRIAPKALQDIKADMGEDAYHDAILRNELLEIVAEIYPILKPYGMKVSEWNCFECSWPPLGELADFASELISAEKIPPESFPKFLRP